MRSVRLFFACLCLMLLHSVYAAAHQGRISIGLDYGPGIIQSEQLVVNNLLGSPVNTFGVRTPENLIPKQLKLRIDIPVASVFSLRIAAGYGVAEDTYEETVRFPPSLAMAEETFHTTLEFKGSGVPVEAAGIVSLPLNEEKTFAVVLGLGVGYYSYTFEASGTYRQSGFEGEDQNFSENYSSPDLEITGIGQFFVAGMDFRINDFLSANFEISKLGLSLLQQKQDFEFITSEDHRVINRETIGSNEQDYTARGGFEDIGISAGISILLSE